MDLDVLAENLAMNMSDRDLIRFVKNLESRVASWNFSEDLYQYFKDLHLKYKRETGSFD